MANNGDTPIADVKLSFPQLPTFNFSNSANRRFLGVLGVYLLLIVFFFAGLMRWLPNYEPSKITRDFEQELDAIKVENRAKLHPPSPPPSTPSPPQVAKSAPSPADAAAEKEFEQRLAREKATREAALAQDKANTEQLLERAYGLVGGEFETFIPSLDAWKWGRNAFMTIGFVVTTSFFIGWLNRWFRDHANQELQDYQYRKDVQRAVNGSSNVRAYGNRIFMLRFQMAFLPGFRKIFSLRLYRIRRHQRRWKRCSK